MSAKPWNAAGTVQAMLPAVGPLEGRVIEGIVGMLQSGKWPEGQRIPSVRELARRFQTSFTTARLAVERLEGLGILQRVHGSGTYVRSMQALQTTISASLAWVALFVDKRPQVTGWLDHHLSNAMEQRKLFPVVVPFSSRESPGRIRESLAYGLRAQPPRAVVLHRSIAARDALVKAALPPHARVICVHHTGLWAPSTWHSVNPDEYAAFQLATRYLIERGHRRIGLVCKARILNKHWPITRRKSWAPNTQQILGAGHALRDAGIRGGLTIHYNLPVQTDPSGIPVDEINVERMVRWLRKDGRPTAVIGEDFRLLGVRKAAARVKLRVPEDLAVVGIGDSLYRDFDDLPYVSLQYQRLATYAAELAGSEDPKMDLAAQHIVVPPQLIRG